MVFNLWVAISTTVDISLEPIVKILTAQYNFVLLQVVWQAGVLLPDTACEKHKSQHVYFIQS
jgi:hypothetical protein